MTAKNKRYIYTILLIGTAISLFYLRGSIKKGAQEESSSLTVNVLTAKESSAYPRKRTFLGQIAPNKTSNLGFELPGTLKNVLVEEGAYVQKGETLATLDMDQLLAKREEVDSERSRINALLELSGLTHDRTKQASELRAVSDTDRDEAEKNHIAYQAAHKAAEARLNQVNIQIGKAHIFAPYSGFISKRYLDEGTVVDAGSPILQLVEIDRVEARIGICRSDDVIVGEEVAITSKGNAYEGKVTSVLPVRNFATKNVEILCSIDNADKSLMPGDPAILCIDETIDQQGFWMPLTALTESSRGLWACYIAKSDDNGMYKLLKQELEIVDQTTDKALVRGALNNGDLVVTDGLNRIIPGLLVHINEVN